MTRQSRQKYPQKLKETSYAEDNRYVSLKLKHKLKPRTSNQEYYMDMMNECTITFAGGPAGTGKTWIATYTALEKLFNGDVDRIIVTKPIIESGDEQGLGALPGEIELKVAPYFQSILDCFEDHVGPMALKKLMESEKIIFLPTAYSRGKSLKHTFLILDEAQNMTRKGIKLMLTRLAEGSYMSINGDSDQCDLKRPSDSGFAWAMDSLVGKSSEIGVVEFGVRDIQRHPLISLMLQNLK